MFLVEGARLIQEGLDKGWGLHTLIAGSATDSDHVERIIERASRTTARVVTTTPKVLAAVSRKDNPQTVLAAFEQRELPLPDQQLPDPARYIALYQVRDPGNLGTILRTADASGVAGVILIDQCCDPYSVECVRATMGSVFSVPFFAVSFDDFSHWRQRYQLRVTAASINGVLAHDEVTYGNKSVLMMGNEQSGLPETVEAVCDELIRIPMTGSADSLNLAQATAIASYQIWKEHGYDGAR